MTLDGDATTYAAALGKPLGSPEVLTAMAMAGFPSTRSDFALDGLERSYYSTEDGAVDFLFEGGSLKSVIVVTQPTGSSAGYARGDALFGDLPSTASRAAVRARLGDPEWTSEDPAEEADQFAVDGYFQHFIFVDDRIARATLMRDDPAEW